MRWRVSTSSATRVDVILGGGAAHWYPYGATLPPALTVGRTMSRNRVRRRSRRAGASARVRIRDRRRRLGAVSRPPPARNRGPLLGLFAAQEFFVQTAEGFGAIYDPPVALADLTAAAIEILSPESERVLPDGRRVGDRPHGTPQQCAADAEGRARAGPRGAGRAGICRPRAGHADHRHGGPRVRWARGGRARKISPTPTNPAAGCWTRCSPARTARSR